MKHKTFNLTYIDTKEDIINILNEAGLPIVAMQNILRDIKEIVDLNAKEIIEKERHENKKKEDDIKC